MKFAERALIMLCLIGYYLAVWRKPADLSVLFVGGGLLSILYIAVMPLLLLDASLKQLFRKELPVSLRWYDWVTGFLFGLFSAYCVFSLIYHNLGEMDSLALVENCGIGLLLLGGLGWWQYRRGLQSVYYQHLLVRAGILLGCICVSFLLHLKAL